MYKDRWISDGTVAAADSSARLDDVLRRHEQRVDILETVELCLVNLANERPEIGEKRNDLILDLKTIKLHETQKY